MTLDTVVTKDKIVTTTVAPVPEIQPIVSGCPPWLHDVGIGELPKVVVSSDGHRLEFVSAPCNSKVNYRSFNYIQKSRCAPSATIRLKNQSQFQKILYTNTSFATSSYVDLLVVTNASAIIAPCYHAIILDNRTISRYKQGAITCFMVGSTR